MITERMILRDIPRLYYYLNKHGIMSDYILGINSMAVSSRTAERRWEGILKSPNEALTKCFNWSAYRQAISDNVDWDRHHTYFYHHYYSIPEGIDKFKRLKLI